MDGHSEGLVEDTLGPDKKPVYKGGLQLSNKSNFDQWFRDVPGVNRRIKFKLDLNKTDTGTYVHDDPNFFPVDGQGWKELRTDCLGHGVHTDHAVHDSTLQLRFTHDRVAERPNHLARHSMGLTA